MTIAAVILAAYVNRADWRAFVLALAVGLSIVWPFDLNVPAEDWYSRLVMAEMAVIFVASVIRSAASVPVVVIHIALTLLHITEYLTFPYEHSAAYALAVPFVEGVSIACICFTSKTIVRGLKWNRYLQT